MPGGILVAANSTGLAQVRLVIGALVLTVANKPCFYDRHLVLFVSQSKRFRQCCRSAL